ncbi:TRAP transporter small permease subunit [Rhodobacteraceae bacterium CCMM004]|nr:TRAP transporter small permease subunit [Rhodobacteraceae bacterium CCMM004]
MTGALTLARWLALPCHLFARLCGLLLLVLTAVILYDVIGRRFFATGSFKLQELEWHLHGAIAILAFGYAYLRDAHVRIDIFAHRMTARFRLKLELAAILLFLVPFMALLLWFGWDFTWRSFTRGEGSAGGIGLPHRWIIKSAIPATAVLTMLGGLAVALRCWVALRRPDLLSDPFERT